MSLFGARRHPRTASLPVEGRLPGFEGATGWLNSSPSLGELRGRVVLVDFWTYTCINWLRTLAFVRAWSEKYGDRGLVVIGVHTPEFPFEREVENVREAAQAMRVEYWIALDSDYGGGTQPGTGTTPSTSQTRRAGSGTTTGEGEYDDGEWMIQHGCARPQTRASITSSSRRARRIRGASRLDEPAPPETYLGYAQGQNLDSPGGVAYDEPRSYVAPEALQRNSWALGGNWTIEERASVLNEAGGRIAFRFHARDVHLVLRSRRARLSRSVCWSTAKRLRQPMGWTSTRRARERWSSHGSINWCASPGRSRTARSRSNSSIGASRRTSSPSASDGLSLQRWRYTCVPSAPKGSKMADDVQVVNRRLDASKNEALISIARMGADAFGYTADLRIDRHLAELLRLRVSQLNNCTYASTCTTRRREAGIPRAKIDTLTAWWETELHSDAEQAALRYAEALTRAADTDRDAAFQRFHDALAENFTPEEILEIVGVVVNMNVWTRIKLAEGAMPGARPH